MQRRGITIEQLLGNGVFCWGRSEAIYRGSQTAERRTEGVFLRRQSKVIEKRWQLKVSWVTRRQPARIWVWEQRNSTGSSSGDGSRRWLRRSDNWKSVEFRDASLPGYERESRGIVLGRVLEMAVEDDWEEMTTESQLSYETPACPDMSLGAEELNWGTEESDLLSAVQWSWKSGCEEKTLSML
jgi:hypothetical protein